jgi:hypothetical protein
MPEVQNDDDVGTDHARPAQLLTWTSYNGKIEVHNSLLNAVLREKPEIERDDPSSKV